MMPHSMASSTGSNHGSVSFEDATWSSRLDLKLPNLENDSIKFGRFNKLKVNTSAIGRTFPNFPDAVGESESESGVSINLGRAPGRRDFEQSPSPKPRSVPVTSLLSNNNTLDLGHPSPSHPTPITSINRDSGCQKSVSPQLPPHITDIHHKSGRRTTPSPILAAVLEGIKDLDNHVKRQVNMFQPYVTDADDSTNNTRNTNNTKNRTRDSRFTQNMAASPNVSSKRQQQPAATSINQHQPAPTFANAVHTYPHASTSNVPAHTYEHAPASNSRNNTFDVSAPSNAPAHTYEPARQDASRAHTYQNASAFNAPAHTYQPAPQVAAPTQSHQQHVSTSTPITTYEPVANFNNGVPTQHSFAIPTGGSNSSSNTLTNDVPLVAHSGRVHSRQRSNDFVEAAMSGPIYSIPMPDNEQDLYQLIQLLQRRVGKAEGEVFELKARNARLNNELAEADYRMEQRNKSCATEVNDFRDQYMVANERYLGLQHKYKQTCISKQNISKELEALETEHKLLKTRYAELVNAETPTRASVHVHEDVSPIKDIQYHNRKQSSTGKPVATPVSPETQRQTRKQRSTGNAAASSIYDSPEHDTQHHTRKQRSTGNASVAAHPVLSSSARHVLDSLCPEHNTKNCTLCTRVTSFGDKTSGGAPIRSGNPVPVSARMPVTTSYEDDVTMRPSQPPVNALAITIKSVEDEIAHLKLKHSKLSTQYNSLDASLGRTERRRLGKELESVLQELDFKADQVYNLYDVLEGFGH